MGDPGRAKRAWPGQPALSGLTRDGGNSHRRVLGIQARPARNKIANGNHFPAMDPQSRPSDGMRDQDIPGGPSVAEIIAKRETTAVAHQTGSSRRGISAVPHSSTADAPAGATERVHPPPSESWDARTRGLGPRPARGAREAFRPCLERARSEKGASPRAHPATRCSCPIPAIAPQIDARLSSPGSPGSATYGFYRAPCVLPCATTSTSSTTS